MRPALAITASRHRSGPTRRRTPTHELSRRSSGAAAERGRAALAAAAHLNCVPKHEGATGTGGLHSLVANVRSVGGDGAVAELVEIAVRSGGTFASGLTAADWLELQFKSCLTPTRMRGIVQFVKQRLGKRARWVGEHTAGYDEVRQHYNDLDCPTPMVVEHGGEGSARCIPHKQAVRALLEAEAVQPHLTFALDGGQPAVRSSCTIDHVRLTKTSGATRVGRPAARGESTPPGACHPRGAPAAAAAPGPAAARRARRHHSRSMAGRPAPQRPPTPQPGS